MRELYGPLCGVGTHPPPLKVSVTPNQFRISIKIASSTGKIQRFSSTLRGVSPMKVESYVVQGHNPAAMRTDVLDRGDLVAHTVAKEFSKRVKVRKKELIDHCMDEWSVPLIRSKTKHVYPQMWFKPDTHFTRAHLGKPRRQFFLP